MSPIKKIKRLRQKEPHVSPNYPNVSSAIYILLIASLAFAFGALNTLHQYRMFENDRHFSHLSNLEREMTFRTEMGLYYSYYKTVVEAPSFLQGIDTLLRDNLTEYPKTINTLKRFNLYPEVILGAAFRVFTGVSAELKWKTKDCFYVNRGEGFTAVLSCEGLGDPAYFYITSVFCWNAAVAALIFIFGVLLSEHILGGILSVASFFYNHGECTRVQWTPPLRESFAFPFWLALMICVTLTLKNRSGWASYGRGCIALFSASFLFTWQFAQFAMLTQTLCVYAVYLLGLTSAETVKRIYQGQIIGLAIAYVFLFGNPLLLGSFYTAILLVSYLLVSCHVHLQFKLRVVTMIVCGVLLITGSFAFKIFIQVVAGLEDDKHIWNLLKSKFSSYKDFHTLLYTCAVEFDFMENATLVRLSQTLLLPTAIFVSIIILLKQLKNFGKARETENSEVIYNLLQLLCFAVMAALFMRLKLFFTPQLCVIISVVASKQYWSEGSGRQKVWSAGVVLLLALMSVQGVKNLWQQQDVLGEYSNPQLEEMLLWVNASTPQDAVFAGPMPTMANLILSTRRPIVNHPHYEDSEARARNLLVYSLYSRKSAKEVHDLFVGLGVQYAVLGTPWCFGDLKPGCAMVDLWDVQDPANRGQPPLCHLLTKNPSPFKKVFSNDHYFVLKTSKY